MKVKITSEKVFTYIKLALVVVLVVVEIVACAKAFSGHMPIPSFVSLVVCFVALAIIETINAFVVKNFVAKMVIYGVDSALLLSVCVLTGNSFLSTLYCIVLTQFYMALDKFSHKTIIFGVSCALYIASFSVGWVIRNVGASLYDSFVEIFSGAFIGLVVLVTDYVVVLFLLKFYNTNKELTAALKEADESRARLEEVYEQLTRTKVYEERNRIAKDIHDNAGHSMTTVIMQTEAAKILIDENPEEAKNRIISANIQARNALDQMRESVHLLAGREKMRPIREEIEEIIAQTIDGTDIKARFDIQDLQPREEVYRFLLNSLKELLANGIRHGKATAFYIELKAEGKGLGLLVSDNGTGVDGDICEGFGLKGIREKAESLGGSCSFSGESGEGFETVITLPEI